MNIEVNYGRFSLAEESSRFVFDAAKQVLMALYAVARTECADLSQELRLKISITGANWASRIFATSLLLETWVGATIGPKVNVAFLMNPDEEEGGFFLQNRANCSPSELFHKLFRVDSTAIIPYGMNPDRLPGCL